MSIHNVVNTLSNILHIDPQILSAVDDLLTDFEQKAARYFSAQLMDCQPYGSYVRGTLLSTSLDPRAAISVMMICKKSEMHPSTYLDRLELFARHIFPGKPHTRSETALTLHTQPFPLRLVPAMSVGNTLYRIPAHTSSGWRHIDPTEFSRRLDFADHFNQKMIRPLVRVIKYWNVCNDYPFSPFQLEYEIVNKGYQHTSGMFSSPRLFDYVDKFLSGCKFDNADHSWKYTLMNRTKLVLARSRRLEEGGRKHAAIRCLTEILPPPPAQPSPTLRHRLIQI